jgi:hypothetical protein
VVTVDYYEVLQGCADLCGLDREKISTGEAATLRNLISKRLGTAWVNQKWPDLVRTEKRYFRRLYAAGTAYVAGDEVFYPSSQKYYLALRATTGHAPADSDDEVNGAYWAECAGEYTADDYDATVTYAAGEQVYDPTTDLYYQCHTASTGNEPTDVVFWGVLVPFERYVAREQDGETALGTVFGAYDANPKIRVCAKEVVWAPTDSGVTVWSCVGWVWVEYRLRAPLLTGNKWSATGTYAAGRQVFFRDEDDAEFGGNFYTANALTSAGESPSTTASKWDVVEIPAIFKGYLEHGAASDYLMPQGEDEAGPHRVMAEGMLSDQAVVLLGQENGRARTEVGTR